jgi:parvulin-like peptidyl-prolyl isomerase
MKKAIWYLAILFILLIYNQQQRVYGSVLLDRVVAKVNNDVITWSELRKSIELDNRILLNSLAEEERREKIKELERSYLNKLIDKRLQLQEAFKLGLDVSDEEIDSAINEIKRKFNLTDESLNEYLKADGLTLEEYKIHLKERILLSKVIGYKITDTIFITEKEIKEYYEANKERFPRQERVRLRQILLTGEDSLKKAEEILQRIKNGEDFAELASEFSEDVSREAGGDLGYVSRGTILKEIEDVAFSLKVGEVSKPIPSPRGIHIIKVEDRIEEGITPEIKEEIKKILFERAYQSKYENWLRELREKAYIEIKL